MAEFFKRDIADWMDGTESLTSDQYRVYDVVLNLIYLHEGPIIAHESGFAGRCNMHVLKFRKCFSELVKMRKLILENGKVSNARAAIELAKFSSNHKPTPRQPQPNPQATPAQPPGNPSPTHERPPPSIKDKSLKINDPISLLDYKEEQKRLDIPSPSSPTCIWPKDFREQFWKRYPRRTEKKLAMTRLEAVMKSGRVSWDSFICAVDRYAVAKRNTEEQYVKQPAVWINKGCWEDEYCSSKSHQTTNEDLRGQVRVTADTPQWDAWQAHLRDKTGKGSPCVNSGWYFPTEWPPGRKQVLETAE